MAYENEIIISSGVTSVGLVAAPEDQGGNASIITIEAGGELASGIVKSGGTVSGTYGATLTDVTADEGAVIDLSHAAATSGMTLRGSNTNIAEGTLSHNGGAVSGYAENGVLYGVSGDTGWRFCVGEGLTVSGATLTSSTRIYAHETAVINEATILQSGNIGLQEDSIGCYITVGAPGVAANKASLMVLDRSQVYHTTVSEGGIVNVRSYAEDTAIYSGGVLTVSANARACDTAVNSGASMNILGGGAAERVLVSGAIITAGETSVSFSERAVATISGGGTVRDMVVSFGGSVNLLSGGVISNFYSVDSANVLSCYGGEINGGSACGMYYTIDDKTGYTNYGRINSGGVIRNFTMTTSQTIRDGAPTWYYLGHSTVNKKRSYAYDVTVMRFARFQISSGTAERTQILSGGIVHMYNSAAIMNDTYISGAFGGVSAQLVDYCGTVNNAVVCSGGLLTVHQSGAGSGIANHVLVNPGGTLIVSGAGSATVDYNPWMGTVTDKATSGGVTYNERNYNVYVGDDTTGTVSRFNDSSNWTLSGFSALVYDDAALTDATVVSGLMTVSGAAVVTGLTLGSKGSATFSSNCGATLSGATILKGGSLLLQSHGVTWVDDLTISSGGTARIQSGTSLKIGDITVSHGGYLHFVNYTAAQKISGTLLLDLTGAKGNTKALVYSAFNMVPGSRVVKASEEVGNYSYLLLSRGGNEGVYKFTLDVSGNRYAYARGASIVNPLAKMTYSATSGGYTSGTTSLYNMSLVTSVDAGYTITAVDTAAALATNGEAVNTTDKMARWTANTTVASAVNLASGMTAGNAWLELDGVTLTKALYGTDRGQVFAGVVNYKVNDGTTVKQLAGGAAASGGVAAVNIDIDGGTFTSAFYAGGFGDVEGRVKVDIADGTFETNVFAGALCNYLATHTATSVDSVTLDIAGGTFDKCIYAGAAVLVGDNFGGTAPVHTAGDIAVTLAGGTASSYDFCVYGGGYAAGTCAEGTAAAVYTAGDADISVSGGAWGGGARGGRGIFGGVYASGVAASVEDVRITITDGALRNVYGGGWAQSNGTSIVKGDVNITISGGSVAHVFGGGSYSSTSGGLTSVAGDVAITISGGTIGGNIYGRGQGEYSTVAGNVTVVFAGDGTYTCGVYGYGVQSAATESSDSLLDLTKFTGTLAGNIGGFDSIRFGAASAATFGAAADNVDNGEWVFDLAGNDGAAPVLTWQGGSFAGDEVILNLDGAAAPETGWSIASGLADADTQYTVNWSFATYELGLGEKIFGGDYDGYGFSVDNGVLKFSKLA